MKKNKEKNLKFHKLGDEQKLRFYQMPKILLSDRRYKGLGLGSMVMYSILRDRQELSKKNNWVDENGFIYLIYTVENLCEILNISDNTVTSYKRKLAKYKLLFEKNIGQGNSNRLYVLKPDYSIEIEIDEKIKDFNFHKVEDEQKLRFYQIPKVLFLNKKYKGLSLNAIAMYSVLRDRQDLSRKNNWIDENEYIYLTFTVKDLCKLLTISNKTVTEYKKELIKYELLFNKKLGQGNPDRLYVLKPDFSEEYTYVKKEEINNEDNDGKSIENTETCRKCDSKDVESTILEVKNSRFKECRNCDSRSEESTIPEMKKMMYSDTDSSDTDSSDTDCSDTDSSDTQSFNHLDMKERKIEDKQIEELLEQASLRRKTTDGQLEEILDNAYVNEYFYGKNYLIIKRAIESLYYRNKPLEINNMTIPIEKVREDLKNLNHFHIDIGLQIFEERSSEQIIRNKIAYLAVCIYNSIFDMDLKIKNDLKYNGII